MPEPAERHSAGLSAGAGRAGERGIEWVQIDEPALVLELPQRGWTHTNPLTMLCRGR